MKVFALSALSLLAAASGLGLVHSAPLTAAPAPAVADGAFKVDPVHSTVIYRIKHMNTSWSYGRFNKLEGSFLFNKDDASKSTLSMTIAADSIDSASSDRDKHLRSPDFFSAKEFPTITYVGKSFKKTGENTIEVSGDLTLHGVTKPLTATIELTGTGKSMQGGEIAGFEAVFTVKRSEFGIKTYLEAIGDDVRLTVAVEGAK